MILFHALAILVAVPLALAQSSFVEWAFERFWLHRGWRPERWYVAHTLVHHQLCRFADTFRIAEAEQREALDPPAWGAVAQVVAGALPWAFVSFGVWLTGWDGPSWTFLAGFVGVLVLDQAGRVVLHRRIHAPGSGRLERTRAFRSIASRHAVHHARPERNLNLLLPLADRVLGTRLEAAPIPAITPVTARRLARRYSRYGEALRVAGRARAEAYGLDRMPASGPGAEIRPTVADAASAPEPRALEVAGRR